MAPNNNMACDCAADRWAIVEGIPTLARRNFSLSISAALTQLQKATAHLRAERSSSTSNCWCFDWNKRKGVLLSGATATVNSSCAVTELPEGISSSEQARGETTALAGQRSAAQIPFRIRDNLLRTQGGVTIGHRGGAMKWTAALRRQRSHVRIVSGAPITSGISCILSIFQNRPGKHLRRLRLGNSIFWVFSDELVGL